MLCIDCYGEVELEVYDCTTFTTLWDNTGECDRCKRIWSVEELLTGRRRKY